MNILNRTTIVFGMSLLILSGCKSTGKNNKIKDTGLVSTVSQENVTNKKTGEITVETKRLQEIAARSTVDKGSASLLTPQKYQTAGNSFIGSYDVGSNNEILASLFSTNGNIRSDLWVMEKTKKRLTKTNYLNLFPSFSSDDKSIYFVSAKGKKINSIYDQKSYIWKINSNGLGGITRIGTPTFQSFLPLESSDGENILYTTSEFFGASQFIWIMNKNGTLPTQLTQGFDASWINDSSVVFSSLDEDTGKACIWTSNTDGSNLTQLICDESMDAIHPQFDNTGRYLAYVKQESNIDKSKEKQSRDVYIYDTQTGLSQQVTTNISRDDMPKWSEDGAYLYFRSSRGLSWNIWRIPTDFLNDTSS